MMVHFSYYSADGYSTEWNRSMFRLFHGFNELEFYMKRACLNRVIYWLVYTGP